MKRLIAVAAFIVLFSVPARAQNRSAGSSGAGFPVNNGYAGGGGSGGGFTSGTSGPLPAYPPAHFAVNAITGTEEAFTPSSFLPYRQAIAAGEAAIAANKKSLVEAAEENNKGQKTKAKLMFVQDADGNVVLLRR